MASVNMTQQLQHDVVANYRKQVQTAYETKTDISSTIECIVSTLQDNAGPKFFEMQKLSEQYGKIAYEMVEHYKATINKKSGPPKNRWDNNDKYAHGYLVNASGYHYDEDKEENVFEPMRRVKDIALVVNKNRDTATNLSMICDWNDEYTQRWSQDDGEKIARSENFVEGDLIFNHTFAEPVFLPFTTNGSSNNHAASEDYSPHASVAVLVTCPKMCDDICSIPETEAKIGQAVDKFEKFLEQFTTLKRFLDNYPEGKSLIPSYAMEKMAAKAKPRVAVNAVKELEVPDDLRDEMNQVILENKLLGES